MQGNALKLKKDLEKSGGVVVGDNEAMQALYVHFPGSVRMEVGSTLSVHFPKPGKPVVKAANILDDLRRRGLYGERDGGVAERGILRVADGPAERRGGH